MARLHLIVATALLGASCASDDASEPAWLQERIEAAEAAHEGYPALAELPDFEPTQSSQAAWQEGLDDMEAMRAEVMADSAALDVEEDADAAAFSRQSRDDAARDEARQSVEE